MTSSIAPKIRRISIFGSASIAALALGTLNPSMALAQDAEEAGADLVVTGSRIAGKALTAPNPIALVSAEEFTLSSSATVENLLNTLPQVVPGESAYTNNEGTAAATIDLRGLGIQRNLVLVNGRRYIFFDQRQVTDLNTVPTALVERVELITGGSSAVYGSDAVSGVVNFILKKNFEGLEATAQYDITGQGDAAKFNADVILGGNFKDNRGNATLYLNYYDRRPTFADARGRSQCFLEDTVVNGAPALACGGSAGIPNGRIAGLPSGVALTARPAVQQALGALGLTGLDANGFKFDDTGENVSRFTVPGDRYNFNPDNYLQLPQKRRMIGGMANYEVTDHIEAYIEGIYTNNIVKQEFAATPISGSYLIQTNSPFLSPGLQTLFRALDATEGTVQTTANGTPILGSNGLPVITPAATRNDGYTSVSIGRRIEEGGTRKSNFERNAYRIVTGLRGDIGGLSETVLTDLKWDAYYSYARTKNVRTSEGVILSAAFAQGVTTKFDANGNLTCVNTANNCVPLNIFGPNISQAGINFITTRTTSSEEATMQVASGVISGNLFSLPAGPVGFAAGFEWRDVSAFSIPSQGGVGDVGVISGGSYDVKEFFGEVRVPIFSSFELNGAFRYSDYSLDKVNGVWTYGGGATWQAIPEVMVRAQYQRAVRAPNVSELFASQSGTSEAATDPCALASAATNQVIRGLCVASGVAQSDVGNSGVQPSFQLRGITGGNPDLEEETTDTYTVGTVIQPMSGLAITVDYYNITIRDAISRLGGSINNVLDLCYNQVQDIDSPYCQAIVRLPDGTIGNGTGINGQPSGVSVLNANIGKIKTDGIDVSLSYRTDIGDIWGTPAKVSFSTSGNWLRNFDVTSVAALPDRVNECADAFGLTCGEPKPEYKITTRLTLNAGGFTSSIRWQHIGSVTDDRVTSGLRDAATLAVPNIKAENYFDLSLSQELGVFKVFGGVINMFDNHQQLIGSSQEQLNTFPSTYDPLGRRFFMGVTMKF